MPLPQSEPVAVSVATDAEGGCCWRVCAGDRCILDRSRQEAMRRLMDCDSV